MTEEMDVLARPLEKMLERMDASAVFGKAEKRGDVTVIPVAEVIFGIGFGFGAGVPSAGDGETAADDAGETSDAPPPDDAGSAVDAGSEVVTRDGNMHLTFPAGGTGTSGGGGGGGRARPLGLVTIGPDGVKYEPIIDVSQIALGGIVLAGWIVFWGTLTVRTVARLFAPARSR